MQQIPDFVRVKSLVLIVLFRSSSSDETTYPFVPHGETFRLFKFASAFLVAQLGGGATIGSESVSTPDYKQAPYVGLAPSDSSAES